MRNQRNQLCSGFSLVEVMVSLFLLGIGAAGTAGYIAYLVRATNITTHRTAAAAHSRAVLEDLHHQGYANLQPGTDDSDRVQTSWTVNTLDHGIKEINLTTEWTTMDGEIKQMAVSSFLSDYDYFTVPPALLPDEGSGATDPLPGDDGDTTTTPPPEDDKKTPPGQDKK